MGPSPHFGLGLQLQAIGGLTQEAEVCRRLEETLDDLDAFLHDLRAGLRDPTVGPSHSLEAQGPPGDPLSIGNGGRRRDGTAAG